MVSAASIGDEFTNVFGNAVEIAIRVLILIVIMTVGWFVARLIHHWARKFLVRVGFDRAMDSGGMRRLLGQRSASDLAAKIIRYALLLLTLHLAFGVFGPNPISDLIHTIVAWLPSLVVAVVIVVIATAIGGAVRDVISRALHGLGYGRALALLAQVAIVALGLIAALNQVGVATTLTMPLLITAFATVGGILVVGLGGGLIKPMQQRWERLLSRAETELPTAAERVRTNLVARDRPAKGSASVSGFGGRAASGLGGQAASSFGGQAASSFGGQAAYGAGSTGAAAQDSRVDPQPVAEPHPAPIVQPAISTAEWLTRDAD